MKKILSFLYMTLALQLPLAAQPPASEHTAEITQLNQQLDTLRKQINAHELAAINAETEAQTFLPAEWDKYAEKMKEVEQHQNAIYSIQQQINTLLAERAKLTQQ